MSDTKIKREVDYEWAEKKAYEKNLQEFLANPFTSDSLKRIQNYAKKHFLSIDIVFKKIKEDDIFARHFVKDPIRQSVHEQEAARFIKENSLVVKFKKLPGSGANALYLHEGEVISKQQRDLLKLSCKSLDFYWEIKTPDGQPNLRFFASHKYTNEEGGAQDHQFTEQRNFLHQAKNSKMGNNTYFLALCEGEFYKKLNKKNSSSRIDFMYENDLSEHSYVMSLGDLDDYLLNKFNSKNLNKESSKKTESKNKLKR